jgi:hypothetical protein
MQEWVCTALDHVNNLSGSQQLSWPVLVSSRESKLPNDLAVMILVGLIFA